MSTHYDCIVIGAGQAGTPLAKKLAQAGKRTALIEKRYIGGTCVNDGCTPTKAMVASARAAYLAGRCNDLGVHIDGYHIDMPRIKQRKDEIVLRFRNGSLEGLKKTKNLDVIFGEATFTGPSSISISLNDGGTQELTADQYFLNTGATPIIPDIEGINDINYLTNTSILELDSVPSHLLIIGGNYIGLEFGQMFRRFGADVTIIERSERMMPREDEDVADCIKSIIEEDGLKVLTNATVQRFVKDDSGHIAATVSVGGISQQITCSALKRTYRDLIRSECHGTQVVQLTGDPDLIRTRQAARHGHFMPPSLMSSQLATLEPLQPDEAGVVVAIGQTPAAVVTSVDDALVGVD